MEYNIFSFSFNNSSLNDYQFVEKKWQPAWANPIEEIYKKKVMKNGFKKNFMLVSLNTLIEKIENLIEPRLKEGAEKLNVKHLAPEALLKNQTHRATWLLAKVQNEISFMEPYLHNIKHNNEAIITYLKAHPKGEHDIKIKFIYDYGLGLLSSYSKKASEILSPLPHLYEFLECYHHMEFDYKKYFHRIIFPNNPLEGVKIFETLASWNTLQTYIDLAKTVDVNFLPRVAIREFHFECYSLMTIDEITIEAIQRSIYPSDGGKPIFLNFSINGVSFNQLSEDVSGKEQYFYDIFDNLIGHLQSQNQEKVYIEPFIIKAEIAKFLSNEPFEGQKVLALCEMNLFLECYKPFLERWNSIEGLGGSLIIEDIKGTAECHIYFKDGLDYAIALSKKFRIMSFDKTIILAHSTMEFIIQSEGQEIKYKMKFFKELEISKEINQQYQELLVSGLLTLIKSYPQVKESPRSITISDHF